MSLYAKLWTDIFGDPKLMRAARKGAKQLVILPWLFAFAKAAEDDGRLTVDGEAADADDLAAGVPGVTTRQVSQCLDELEEIGVLARQDDGVLAFTNWEKRSGHKPKKSPSDAPEAVNERVKRFRDKRKGDARNERNEPRNELSNEGETKDVTTHCNEAETSTRARARSRAGSRELEIEPELELDQELLSSAARLFSVAANRGLAEHPERPQLIPRIIATDGRTHSAAVAMLKAGVEPSFAERRIYERAKTHTAEGEITSLRYFEAAIVRDWRARQAGDEAGSWSPPASGADATQNGRRPGSSRDRPRAADRRFAGDRNDAVLDAWAREADGDEAEVTLELPDLDPEPADEPETEEVRHGE